MHSMCVLCAGGSALLCTAAATATAVDAVASDCVLYDLVLFTRTAAITAAIAATLSTDAATIATTDCERCYHSLYVTELYQCRYTLERSKELLPTY
jgi:hypothetical protein